MFLYRLEISGGYGGGSYDDRGGYGGPRGGYDDRGGENLVLNVKVCILWLSEITLTGCVLVRVRPWRRLLQR